MQRFEIPAGYVARGYNAIVDGGAQFSEVVFVPDDGPDDPWQDPRAIAIKMTLESYNTLVRYVAKDGVPDIDWKKIYHDLRSMMQEYLETPGFACASEQEPPFIAFSHNGKRPVRIQSGVDGFDLQALFSSAGQIEVTQDLMAYPTELKKLADAIRAWIFGPGSGV